MKAKQEAGIHRTKDVIWRELEKVRTTYTIISTSLIERLAFVQAASPICEGTAVVRSTHVSFYSTLHRTCVKTLGKSKNAQQLRRTARQPGVAVQRRLRERSCCAAAVRDAPRGISRDDSTTACIEIRLTSEVRLYTTILSSDANTLSFSSSASPDVN